ncbi:MAG TPA: hypothetical protein VMP89_11560 [Solirubrobacteraceae bacterium]|nr:hypothetical protein [Solirubrobacteraceae bacterium]
MAISQATIGGSRPSEVATFREQAPQVEGAVDVSARLGAAVRGFRGGELPIAFEQHTEVARRRGIAVLIGAVVRERLTMEVPALFGARGFFLFGAGGLVNAAVGHVGARELGQLLDQRGEV